MLKRALWSALRLPILLASATVVLLALAFLLDTAEGSVIFDWLGYNFSVKPGFLLVSVLVAAFLLATAGASWAKVAGLPRKWRMNRHVKSLEGLLAASTGAIAANAADNPKGFSKAVAAARRVSSKAELTRLLEACKSGDRKKWKDLLKDRNLSLPARQYLANLALADGQPAQAADYAEDAAAEDPAWAASITAVCAALEGDWRAAEQNAVKSGEPMLQATIATQRALNAADKNEAKAFTRKALEYKKDFVPAALRLTELLSREEASRLIIKIWRARPHPALLRAADEELLEKLARIHPTNPLSQTAAAMTALSKNQLEKAERILAPISGSAAADKVMAQVYRHQGLGDKAERIEDMTPAENYLKCGKCNTPAKQWQAICPRCRSFGSMSWSY